MYIIIVSIIIHAGNMLKPNVAMVYRRWGDKTSYLKKC